MPSAPLLSIVTISFNQARYLRQCVDSVLSQKDAGIEYIVVDPGSTDGSREILAGYGDAIDRLVLAPDDGPADGLNNGFAIARGRYGYYINSDDFLVPGGVARLAAAWARDPGAGMLLGEAWLVDGNGAPRRRLIPTPVSLDALRRDRCRIVQQGQSFRLDRYRALGGFNIANRTCWDFELVCAMAQEGAWFAPLHARIGAFRLHDASLSGGAAGERHRQRFLADLDRIRTEVLGVARTGGDVAPARPAARLAASLAHPRQLADRLADRLVPGRMMRRWEDDARSTMP